MKLKFKGLLAFSLLVTLSYGQISLATRAFKEMEAGNLGEAKGKIDLAMEHPQAQQHKRAWYYYGRIYEESYNHNKNHVYIKESIKGYIKSIDLEKDRDSWGDVKERLAKLGEEARKTGVSKFKSREFEDAEMFFLASMLASKYEGRTDSINYLNIAVTNDKLQEYDRAVAYLDTCISWGYQTQQCAALTLKIYRKQGKQNMVDKKITEYRNLYPENEELLLVDVNNHIQNKRNKEAIATVSRSIAKYPKNDRLYVIRGNVHFQLNDKVKAEKDYLKAIEVNANSFEANMAAAKFYHNSDLNKAIPFYEKAYEISPKRENVGQTLLAAYKSVGNNKKYMVLKSKLK